MSQKQSKRWIKYRRFVELYFLLSMFGFCFPVSMGAIFVEKGNVVAFVLRMLIGLLPNIIVSAGLVALTYVVKVRSHPPISHRLAQISMIGTAIVLILSMMALFYLTVLRWNTTYTNTGSMDGTFEWVIAWIMMLDSGFIVFAFDLLSLSSNRIKNT